MKKATHLVEQFRAYCGSALDISEHLGLLRGLACDPKVVRIVEIGFRKGVSATALCTAGKSVVAYDIEPCQPHCVALRRIASNFEFRRESSLTATIPECDLLHIDSLHTFKQLDAELQRHHHRVSRWIALHDTETFGDMGQDKTRPGLKAAIQKLLSSTQWVEHLHLTNNNGLTLLRRREP